MIKTSLRNLQPDEIVSLKTQAQRVKGFPQTVGTLYLTNKRLILTPNQLLSLGFGKHWEINLSDIKSVGTKGRFRGGPFMASGGNRLILNLKDGTKHILSLLGSIDELHSALLVQMENQSKES